LAPGPHCRHGEGMSTATRGAELNSKAPWVRRRPHGPDAWVWFAFVVGGIFWASTTRPLSDPDVWWHVRTGRLILDSGVPHTEPWAFTALGRPWVPTAWLSDVLLAEIHTLGGWHGIVAFKVIVSGILLLSLGRELADAAPQSRIWAPVFAISVLTLSPFLSERPQLISFLFVVWLASTARRVWSGGEVPWWAIAVGYLWANVHGMWLLAPLAFAVVAVGLALDQAPRWRPRSGRAAIVAIAITASAALTPAGPRLVYWPLVVRDAASDISEWQPTDLVGRYGLFFMALFLLWVTAVARTRLNVPRSEILWMSASFLFSLQAARNLAPAVLLMAPFVAVALARVFQPALDVHPPPRLPRFTLAATALLAIASTGTLAVVQPALVDGLPLRIVERLKQEPGQVRVLDSYNVGGILTGFGAPKISVAIDGRTDNYDPHFVHRYLAASSGQGDWRDMVAKLDADFAVLGRGGTLAIELRRDGWTKEMTDGDFVLLRAPSSS
jgi:hypothetical protein